MTNPTPPIVEDKIGIPVELTEFVDQMKPILVSMYDAFSPKAVTQGLPPAGESARLKWIENLLSLGLNFVAWQEERIIGHASVILDDLRENGEYLIFVDHTVRNRGVGTLLTTLALDRAKSMGLKTIWLTVEALNFRAIKLYKKMGFIFCDSGERERTMILHL